MANPEQLERFRHNVEKWKEDRQQREVLFSIRLDDAVMQTSQA